MSLFSSIKLPYTRRVDPSASIFLQTKNCPLIKIGLLSNSTLVKILAYIDTGAQVCLFENSYAKELGIRDYKDVKKECILPLSGIGGKQPENVAFFHDYTIYLL